MSKLNYITTNQYKFKLAQKYFEANNHKDITLVQKNLETPEIQSDSTQAVAEYSARWASQKLNEPVVCLDVGFSIIALDGFPGPFIKYINQWLCPADVLKLMEGKPDYSASFIDVLAYATPDGKCQVFTDETAGKIVKDIGTAQSKWTIDALFMPNGFDKTLAMMSDEEKDSVWSQAVWDKLVVYIST